MTMQILMAVSLVVLPELLIASCQKDQTQAGSSITPVSADTILSVPGWTLVWHDEFIGPDIDTTKWEWEVNGEGGGNNELQYYTASRNNSSIEDGKLIIKAIRESYLGKNYTSARMRTKNKGDWKYGRFEARMKLPYGQGMWPAFWMLPTDWVYGGWPTSGELDVMEMLGHETNKVYGTIHWGDSPQTRQQAGENFVLRGGTFAGDFHTFAVEWDSTGFKWFVDSTQYFAVNKGWPFDQRFHILLNLAVGGNWPGSPNEFTHFPQPMYIDYVRVYKRS